ncbi:hypothetical protein SEA_SAPO_45 [Gordonia phage Sapo]|nr:hypothetical protein SEA_SAPO_45 [Gordonia phage Sapo]
MTGFLFALQLGRTPLENRLWVLAPNGDVLLFFLGWNKHEDCGKRHVFCTLVRAVR